MTASASTVLDNLDPASSAVSRLEQWLDHIGDRLNPILVKETRQALKSRQFVLTFVLVLASGWVWSILGVALQGPAIHVQASGSAMFSGYFLILAFPLLVIVPFTAFRSITVEREDRTFELLAITTLNARQIVSGKLASTFVQMLVYLSAISPCLAFTYLLRGIDFPTILLVTAYTVAISFGLSLCALLLGTLAGERHRQTVLSVLVILALFGFFWFYIAIVLASIGFSAIPQISADSLPFHVGFLMLYGSYFALFYYVAAAQLSFVAGNRSTAVRVVLVIQEAFCAVWIAWLCLSKPGSLVESLLFLFFLHAIHWLVVGTFLAGESPFLSQRVRRDLPQSFLGRMFLTWLNPGPGTGFMLVVSAMLAALVASVLVGWLVPLVSLGSSPLPPAALLWHFALVAGAYVVVFVGWTRLLVGFWRRLAHVSWSVPLLVSIVLISLAAGVPYVLQLMSREFRDSGYTLLQITNPLWSLEALAGDQLTPLDRTMLLVMVPGFAAIVFLLNMPQVLREVQFVRIAKPQRLVQEELVEASLSEPAASNPASPWD
jgi:hypothetical protein